MLFLKKYRCLLFACSASVIFLGMVSLAVNAEDSTDTSSPFLPDGVEEIGWPHVRGPNLDGHSPEIHLANEWPKEGPPVLWVRELGQGYSSFSAKGDRVYTQYQTVAGQFVICLNSQTGEEIWSYRYDWPYEIAGQYPGPRATPTLAGNRIAFAGPSGLVGCLSKDGDLLWSVDVIEKFNVKNMGFGYSISPTVVNGVVYLPVGGEGASMVALDLKDGSIIWKSGNEIASYTPALPITINGHKQIIGYMEHGLVAFDAKNGKQLWIKKMSQGYDEHAAWPIYREPHLWIAGPFRSGSQLLKLTGGKDSSCKPIRQSSVMSNDVASSVLVGDHLYGFDIHDVQAKPYRPTRGAFRCIDWFSGEERWVNGNPKDRRRLNEKKRDASGKQNAVGHASVIVADGKLILFNDLGELILAKASPEKYTELARATVLGSEICWTAPVLHRGCIYVRNQTHAACIYIGEPSLLSKRQTDSALTISDLPQQTFWDLTHLLGIEPEYAMDVPSYPQLKKWFLFSLGLLAVAGTAWVLVWFPLRKKLTSSFWQALFWLFLFVSGAVSTAPLSIWQKEFVFTWPVSLFAVFAWTAEHLEIKRTKIEAKNWRGWFASKLIGLPFAAVCIMYLLLCRRLSLATEWIFLTGFIGALPVMLVGKYFTGKPKFKNAWRIFFILLAFTAYYWASIGWLALKYKISEV